MNGQAPAQGHHSWAASCVRNWPHPLVGQHQFQDPQGPASRDPRTQLHPPVTQHWSQNTQGFGLTHQQLDTPLQDPALSASGSLTHQLHPLIGRHQLWDALGQDPTHQWADTSLRTNLALQPAHQQVNASSETLWDLLPAAWGSNPSHEWPTSASGHPGACGQSPWALSVPTSQPALVPKQPLLTVFSTHPHHYPCTSHIHLQANTSSERPWSPGSSSTHQQAGDWHYIQEPDPTITQCRTWLCPQVSSSPGSSQGSWSQPPCDPA